MSTNQIPDDALDAQLRNIMSAVGIGLAMFERSPPAMVEMRNALRAAVAALAPASSIPLTDARIREICLSHGYTIKPGCNDLKPYVYAAARQVAAEAVAAASADGRGTEAQIIREREIASCNIMGALAAGAAGQPEPEPEYGKPHWLLPAHQAGAELAQAQQERDTARALVDNYSAEVKALRAEVELIAVNLAGERQFCAAVTAERDTLRANCKMWMERSGKQAAEIERLKAPRARLTDEDVAGIWRVTKDTFLFARAIEARCTGPAPAEQADTAQYLVPVVKDSLTAEPVANTSFDRREPSAPAELAGAYGKGAS